jgi:predicted metal-dependent phosphoesterase TrpH
VIDLHSHTNQSDGTFSPTELIDEALRVGVNTLAITDHDTLAGYDQAKPYAASAKVNLICGIELSTKLNGNSVHLLGYFFDPNKLEDFRDWILELQAARRERNVRLAARLQQLGFDVTLEEAEARGRGMTGRPHFAQVMIEKGYTSSVRQTFDDILGESGPGYVDRKEPQFATGVEKINQAGGISSLAHPVRIKGDLPAMLPALCTAGLRALEAYHSDHRPQDTEQFLALAKQYGLKVTGGSDFHGLVKPEIQLGTGRSGNIRVPDALLGDLLAQSKTG